MLAHQPKLLVNKTVLFDSFTNTVEGDIKTINFYPYQYFD